MPTALVADVLLARRFERGDVIVLCLAAGWILMALAPLPTRWRPRVLKAAQNPLLSFCAVCLTVIPAEVSLRLWTMPPGPRPMLYRPYTRFRSVKDPAITPGVSGTSNYSVNNVGVRGPDLPLQANLYRIITVGGSTTECEDLDDRDEWPRLLMTNLNRELGGERVWVGNAGLSGHTAVHHLWMMQTLPLVARSDMLILMTGINDLWGALAARGQPAQAMLEADARRFYTDLVAYSPVRRPYFKRLELYELVRRAGLGFYARFLANAEDREDYPGNRKRRALAPRAALPPLHTGLEEYSRRILDLAGECRNNGQRCVFLTQPTMWRATLSEAERRLLWFGWVGPHGREDGYASVEDLAAAMDAYNLRLLDICSANGLECYDLAAAVPKDTSAFLDDCHFNVGGARAVATFIAQQLMRHPELLEPRPRRADTGKRIW